MTPSTPRVAISRAAGAPIRSPADPRQSRSVHERADSSDPVFRFRQVFRGDTAQIRELRRWLEALLPERPARDDVITVAAELATNAVKHTRTGRGGWFAVEVSRHGDAVRVAVTDQGASHEPRLIDDPMAESGRGLLVVHHLSARTGIAGDERGRLVWADVLWGVS